jgi:K+/H+ antiporter YhaU regulatory subunit KhtT
MTVPRRALGEVGELADLKVETFMVQPQHWVNDHTVAEIHLVAAGAGFVAAIKRGGKTITNPKPFETLVVDDVLYLVAAGGRVSEMVSLLERGELESS